MAKKNEEKDEGLDMSMAREIWSEEELRELIREEAMKLLGHQGQSGYGTGGYVPNTTQPQPPYQIPITWSSGQLSTGQWNSSQNYSTNLC